MWEREFEVDVVVGAVPVEYELELQECLADGFAVRVVAGTSDAKFPLEVDELSEIFAVEFWQLSCILKVASGVLRSAHCLQTAILSHVRIDSRKTSTSD